MSFSENLRESRKSKGISQEQLAEALGVSRQAVSKYESGISLPETDKLITIAEVLGVSIDYLLTDKQPGTVATIPPAPSGKILIKTYDGKAVINCIKVTSSPILLPTKNEPKYILNGVDKTGFLGDHSTILAFYEEEEHINKEINAIYDAMSRGEHSYELKYLANVSIKGLSPKLIK